MSGIELIFERDDEIATILFNRPDRLNAIDAPLSKAFGQAVKQLKERVTRVIVLRGAGRAFVAGGDVKAFADDFDAAGDLVAEILSNLNPAIETLTSFDAPIIGCARGAVAGAGLSLLSICDLVVSSDEAKFLMAYDRIGATIDCGGTWFLPRRIGRAATNKMFLLSETWDVEKALSHGLVDYAVPDGSEEEKCYEVASQLLMRPTLALGSVRRLLNQSENNSLREQLRLEEAAFVKATKTADFRDGVEAFVNKHRVDFLGK